MGEVCGGGRRGMVGGQLICLGDDSPMLGIYSIRDGGGQAVWVEASTASSLR